MDAPLTDLRDLALMTAGYWAVDHAVRKDGVVRAARRAGLQTVTQFARCAVPLALAAAVGVPWHTIGQGDAVRVVAATIAALLTWKATTKDIDVVTGRGYLECRLWLVVAALGAWYSPMLLLVVAVLLTTPFGTWQHHATLPMRLLQACVAWVVCSLVARPWGALASAHVLFWFLLTIQISHYFITALAKGGLGPKWYSWVVDNRLHHLAASAYSWGWARFLPWERWVRVVQATRRVERPAQAAAFSVELLAPLAMLHPWAGIGFCIVWSAFHLGVFSLSGLLFWDWMGANLAVALGLWLLPAPTAALAFGGWSLLLCLVFMVVFPLRHKLWTPIPLGWWDTPMTQRVHWIAEGRSGQAYGVYADTMCPHERLFGKVNACFLAPVPVFTYHLGEVWKHELRDAIRAAGPDLERLDEVRERYGVLPRSEALEANHIAYLQRFFHQLNHGAQKAVLPAALRWLKAPGGQVFYWGDLPPYRRQEVVESISLRYREEYFDGERICRLRDDLVLRIPIDESAGWVAPVEAPTPKAIDDFLLSYANGRLIDLPEFADGFVRSDDGKPEHT